MVSIVSVLHNCRDRYNRIAELTTRKYLGLGVFNLPEPDDFLSVSELKDVAEGVIAPLRLPGVEGANTSYSRRKLNSRYSNSEIVSVTATFKKSSTDATPCRGWFLLDTISKPCRLSWESFYNTFCGVASFCRLLVSGL